MGRINSDIGLITGVPITQTVNQLIALAARPRDLVIQRTEQYKAEQVAVTQLTALLVAVQVTAKRLGDTSLFDQRNVQSLNPDALKAVADGKPALGTYQFTPLQLVRSQQLMSSGVASDATPLGVGKLSIRFGGAIDDGVDLALLNGGAGLSPGRIRITDRGGATAEIDLRYARSLDEVLDAINVNTTINVRAETRGDGIRLVDQTGQSTSNLKVNEVGDGRTAASLGLAGVDIAANEAVGSELLRLFDGLTLDRLNVPRGVRMLEVLPDAEVHLRDGSTVRIDFKHLPRTSDDSDQPTDERTLGDVLATINSAAPDKLRADIAPDGDRIVLRDLSQDAGHSFTVTAEFGSDALEDLGLTGDAVDGVITGRRLIGGLATPLLANLNGGKGLGQLGVLRITDRSGAQATVDLAAAETVDDVLSLINAAGLGVRAELNAARNGIRIVDTTAAAGSLTIASGDDLETAERLHLAVDATTSDVNSGNLHVQVVGEATRLSTLNGGQGVAKGLVRITDANGATRTVPFTEDTLLTVGDVVNRINELGLDVLARINDAGDGILLESIAQAQGKIRVEDLNSSAAADLRIAGESSLAVVDTVEKQVINGTTTVEIELDENDALSDLVSKINASQAGVLAGEFNDGGALNPFHLTLVSQRPGRAGELLIDGSQLGLQLSETVQARDAKLLLGAPDAAGGGAIVTSDSNTFEEAIPGLKLQALSASETAVTVTVEETEAPIVEAAKAFVDAYNVLRKKLGEYTAYNTETNKGGILLGDSSAWHVDADFSALLRGAFFGVGKIQAIEQVGISLKSDGTLALDADRLRSRYAESPEDVERFFHTEKLGLAARVDQLVESLASAKGSILVNRARTLDRKITANDEKVASYNEQLLRKRDRLLNNFYRMETAIAKLQDGLNALGALTPVGPLE